MENESLNVVGMGKHGRKRCMGQTTNFQRWLEKTYGNLLLQKLRKLYAHTNTNIKGV